MIAQLLALIDTPENKSKFEKLYEAYERLMFYVARKRLGDEHLAEDAVNEAFIRIINNIDKIDGSICPRTQKYVVVIVRNVCADMYAKRNKIDEFFAGDELEHLSNSNEVSALSSQEAFFEEYDLERISYAVKQLPEIYQGTLYLYVVEEKSQSEIAKIMKCSVDTVKKRIYRARRYLKAYLEEEDGR